MTNITTKSSNHAASLTPEQEQLCKETAAAIRNFEAQTKTEIVRIGTRLIKVKDILGHGGFGKWLKSEVGYTERTAQNYMNVARAFGDKYEIVSGLPAQTTYQLAAMPDEKRAEIVTLIKDPEDPPVKMIKTKIEDFRHDEKLAKVEKEAKAKRSPAAAKARKAQKEEEEAARKALMEKTEREETAVTSAAETLAAKLGTELLREVVQTLDLPRSHLAKDVLRGLERH